MKAFSGVTFAMCTACAGLAAVGAWAQGGLDASLIGRSPEESWSTYHGDYSGRHYSPLTQINGTNVKSLSQVWSYRPNTGRAGAIVGGTVEAPVPITLGGGALDGGMIKATPIYASGVLYLSTPDNAWAVDARSGQPIWHYFWKTSGGEYIGNRGMAIYGDYLYFGTPDGHLVSLEAASGKERWHKQIGDVRQNYFSSTAPVVIGRHLIVGLSGDALDVPGWIESRDVETGELQWKWYTTPAAGSAEARTWPNERAMRNGGGMTWQPVTYDPDLHLIYVATGNPNPVYNPELRAGDNLYSCSLVALDVDTGKLVWYYQTSQNEAWDFDANQVPILFDATYRGKTRKLVAQATRGGMYFLLDRATGEHLLTKQYAESVNWAMGFDAQGHPIRNPDKLWQQGGALISPANGGIQNWTPPAYMPETGAIYLNVTQGFDIHYAYGRKDERGALGHRAQGVGGYDTSLRAIDALTGEAHWVHRYAGTEWRPDRPEHFGGLLATAGSLVFAGAPGGFMVGYDPRDGRQLWHANLPALVSNSPITYMMDGRQYLIFAAHDTLYAYALP